MKTGAFMLLLTLNCAATLQQKSALAFTFKQRKIINYTDTIEIPKKYDFPIESSTKGEGEIPPTISIPLAIWHDESLL